MSIVAKFGGSSLADAEQFRKVRSIIEVNSERKYVVPSAPGKRDSGDVKVTDMLYSCYEKVAAGEDITELFQEIEERYNGIIKELGLALSLHKEYEIIKNALQNNAGRDFAASRGEYLNGMILAAFLGYEFVDAATVIFFNEDGSFQPKKTNDMLRSRLLQCGNAVIPGFYGMMPNGTIKTFSRGGSDITGSLVACAVTADIYENWTDVSGLMIADPRIVDQPKIIKTITYKELRELSYMGATVLHEDAIFPVRIDKIPINIRNTNRPEDEGTMIVSEVDNDGGNTTITGIAGKKGFSVISIEKAMMNQETGFGKKVLEVLEKQGISFEHLPSGIDTMSVVVATKDIAGVKNELISEINEAVHADSVDIHNNLALIAVVGRGMIRAKGTAAKVFHAVYEADINIRMIDQGSSELNIIIGVDEDDFVSAIKTIYKAFLG
ncbi:MAG: aspartate kinase [Clostridiales bacterium 43-6]|nr:MAG: aspartate kinase [Clostridiales bacterium 43-6]